MTLCFDDERLATATFPVMGGESRPAANAPSPMSLPKAAWGRFTLMDFQTRSARPAHDLAVFPLHQLRRIFNPLIDEQSRFLLFLWFNRWGRRWIGRRCIVCKTAVMRRARTR
ncbi:MAG: hypothetical protein RR482_08185, partial [Clostridia bacterium]